MAKNPPRPETQMATTGLFRILVFAVFPIGYIYLKWNVLPWPMLAWGVVMGYLALHDVAKIYADQREQLPMPKEEDDKNGPLES